MENVSQNNLYYSGTSGLVLPVSNKQMYPPGYKDKPRLAYYSALFNSIEINSSFYKVPMASTVSKWAETVPQHFRFTYKLWREITHNKELFFRPESINRFMQVIGQTGKKQGCLLVQFPGSIGISYIRQFENLLQQVQQANTNNWNVAIEFRNRSWYNEDVYDMLAHYSAGMVIQDMPKCITPITDMPAPFIYLRFHGPNGGYRGSYTDDFLYDYAQYINEWMAEGKTVYAYFNNTMGDAINNLCTLNQYVSDAIL